MTAKKLAAGKYQVGDWIVTRHEHPYSSKPRWVGELFDASGALVDRHEKLSLKVLKQCIELVSKISIAKSFAP